MREPKPEDILVWNVLEGPINAEDMPYDEQPDHPEYVSHLILVVSDKAKPLEMFEYELWFGSLDEAYKYKRKVDMCMEPKSITEVLM